mmetsp:Transcript_5081/g.14590  ORF Transcript_5081/g.14590 Transcript_5081/m.14590 type:complete len:241 (+) Transcript_5081:616-1338(+)
MSSMDDIKDARDSAVKSLESARDQASVALDDGLAAASSAARSSIAYVMGAANEGKQLVEQESQGAMEVFDQYSEHAFYKLKEGFHWARENENITVPAAVTALALILPGPRRFLWRQTLGRFRSEESLFRAAERKYSGVTESLEAHSVEGQKLQQRLAAAQEQYDTGLRKCIATAKQISALQSRVRGTEKSASSLVRDLRELPSRDALALRAQAAAQVATAASQRKSLDSTLWNLSKKGLY